ncbi:MAG TPA: ScyD/ScyE family protein, partial [Aggregatilineales bacterium]|nr:ScyD/ScyE family protein [Aggregatilineales bacterium]
MRTKLTLMALFALLIGILPSMAQDDVSYTVLVEGLNNPRGINFSPDGVLYVAEAGVGGDIDFPEGPFGPAMLGFTGRVSAVVDGVSSTVIDYLPSVNPGGEPAEILGTMDVVATDDQLWVVMGHELKGVSLAGTVVAFDRISLRPNQVFDPYGYEHQYDPDATGELLSNPTSVAVAPDGLSALIADASGNTLYRTNELGGLDVVKSWENNPVPTTVAFSPDGSQYAVGFLISFPFPTGASRIELYDAATDELIFTAEGLTAITDVLFGDDGVLLAVSYGEFSGETFSWIPNSGSVLAVSPDGVGSLITGLQFPYSIAKNPVDGSYAVSVNAVSNPGEGQIIT